MKFHVQKQPPVKFKKRKKPGPEKILGGTRMNFLPGEKLRKEMIDLKKEVKSTVGENLTFAYLLREGVIKEIQNVRSILKKASNGQLGAKQRKGALFLDNQTGIAA